MASSTSTKQHSSRFSTFKVFRFTGSKPPRPPPKDPNYLYPASNNPSLVSLSSQSLYSQPASTSSAPPQLPKNKTNGSGALSLRSPSPTPSRILQSSPLQYQEQQPPLPSMSASTLVPDSSSSGGKRGFFRKMSTIGKRSTPKPTRVVTADDATDDETISRPYNVQHHIHIDESFQGIPPAWTSTLAELGYSEAEIALILKGRRNRGAPEFTNVQVCPVSTSTSLSRSPTTPTTIPVKRSFSLRRQRSDGSIASSKRSLRNEPPLPPPPLPLPPPPRTPQAPACPILPPAVPPPTPASSAGTSVEAGDVDVAARSEAQYVYVNHHRDTPNGPVAVLPGKVPVIQPAPVRQQRSNSNATPLPPPSPVGSVSSGRERRMRTQPAPRRQFRVVNTTSPPPVYSDDLVPSGPPPPITLEDASQPRPEEKDISISPHSTAPTPRDRIKTPPQDSPLANRTLDRGTVQEQEGQDHAAVRNSNEPYRSRPTDLSILPPRISLRKDTLEDLSSWSASLFSSLPSALHDSPASSASTAPTSAGTSQGSRREITKHRTKPSVTLPTIVLHPEVREEDEDEHQDDGEDAIEHDYSHSASPLYQELMGMMQERATVSNGSPASLDFQLDAASSSSQGASPRDSQLTIRFDPRRDSNRDSSASTSTLTHATIVRGASIVRRVRADVVTTPRTMAMLKGKERAREQALVQVVQEDDGMDEDEGGSSSDDDDSDEERATESPVDTLALTSGPNSQEEAGSKSPRQVHAHRFSSPLPSPSPSPLRSSFPESQIEEPQPEQEQEQEAQDEEAQKVSTQVPYITPPPSAPPATIRQPSIAIATDLENIIGISPSSLSTPMGQTKEIEEGPVLVTTPRYPSWLAAVVLPLAEFIDDSADPRVLFTDLQEIAQGESGSVYSACAAPTVAPQFQPSTPSSPASEMASPEQDEGHAQPKQGLVAIKCVPLLRGHTEKVADLRRELELSRALRHPNVLCMERLYVDVAEESLWIGMELMDRSLADVLAVVGEEAGSAQVALEAQEDGSDGGSDSGSSPGGSGVVELSEKMVARFVRDVLSALSYIRKHHIAHRDVRSDNLLLSKAGVLKLSDFSNAVFSPSGTPKRSDSVGVIYWQAPEMRTGLYDPLKVDVWSLGATTWELVHGDPPFADVQDMRHVGGELPPLREPEAFSRSFHDFLHLCSQPAASRPDPDELLDTDFMRTACPRSEIVRLLGQCRAIDEQQLLRQSNEFSI